MLHTHEATGSSPVVSTIDPPKLYSFGGFLLLIATYSWTLFLTFWADPQVDPHGKTTRKDERAPGRIFLPGAAYLGPSLLHLATDDRSDGIRRILLHLRCGVGVGVQREAC